MAHDESDIAKLANTLDLGLEDLVKLVEKDPAKFEAAILVCSYSDQPTPYNDNVFTECACGAKIMHRPHAPKHAIPTCAACALESVEDEKRVGNKVEMVVTEKTAEEVRRFLDGRRQ